MGYARHLFRRQLLVLDRVVEQSCDGLIPVATVLEDERGYR